METRAARIRAVALDVDGVLTDGAFWWGPDGSEWKRFSFRDIMGISRASKAGLVFALISGEENELVTRYARKMNITSVYQGCKDKAVALRSFAKTQGLDLAQVCFMGDDINDVPALQLAGLPAAPADAHPSVLAVARYIARQTGGNGAVRELVDFLSK
ncbi:MAG: HAD hydrolase family protein [Kiritimatiellaeota bacterium]|nr:HAD hydrolase family protein [Kiritimatiellota bacterium]